ncbi:MAG: SCO family protein [Silicimonas sp.]|nr:SCO family protein [Silicimonas sp.]
MSKLSRPLKFAIFGLLALNLALIAYVTLIAPRMNASVLDTLGRGDYALEMTGGETFTQASLKGAPSAVFFGFTHCPDVCPTTLGEVLAWQEDLGGETPLQVFFVTVDPERDTLEVLTDYVGWVPGVRAATGSAEEVQKAIRAFKIFAQKVPTEDGYTMDHSASVLLFDADGRFVETISYGTDHEVAMGRIRGLLGV